MIKIEKVVTPSGEQWDAIIRGMRNPKNSWDRSDSGYICPIEGRICKDDDCIGCEYYPEWQIGDNDLDLTTKLARGGAVHAKYRRMITVYLDITAPLYWWKEFDTYKVGTVSNSCSTMHKIHEKEFTLEDFSCEHLDVRSRVLTETIVETLNRYRELFVNYNPDDYEVNGCPSEKDYWWQMIQLLPSSYNQKRTIMLNYEVLVGMYRDRKTHKLDEWREFCKWIETLPYSELITGGK